MGAPPYRPLSSGNRRLNPDGRIGIACRICGQEICKRVYDRWSTATCAVCQGLIDSGMNIEEVTYRQQQAEAEQMVSAQEQIGATGFRAHGIRQRVKEVVDTIKERIAKKRKDITRE